MTHRIVTLSQVETANAVQEVALLKGTSARTAVRATRAAGRSARRRADGMVVRGLEGVQSRIEVRPWRAASRA